MRESSIALILLIVITMTGCFLKIDQTDPDIFIMETDGSNLHKVHSENGIQFTTVSADGRYLFVRQTPGEGYGFVRLTVYNLETGEDKCYGSVFDEYSCYPLYSTAYILGRYGHDSWHVKVMDIDAGTIELVPEISAPEKYSTLLSPSQNTFSYSKKVGSEYVFNRIDLNTGAEETLTSNTYTHYRYPAFSPDGNSLYYFHQSGDDSRNGLYRYDLVSGTTQHFPYDEIVPSAKQIQVGVDERFLIINRQYLISLDETHTPVSSTKHFSSLQLLPDRTNALCCHKGLICRIDMITGSIERITWGNDLWVSPFGEYAVFTRGENHYNDSWQ